jgi:hypothetical protein
LGGGDRNAACNNPEIGSLRDDDLLFYSRLMVRKIKKLPLG